MTSQSSKKVVAFTTAGSLPIEAISLTNSYGLQFLRGDVQLVLGDGLELEGFGADLVHVRDGVGDVAGAGLPWTGSGPPLVDAARRLKEGLQALSLHEVADPGLGHDRHRHCVGVFGDAGLLDVDDVHHYAAPERLRHPALTRQNTDLPCHRGYSRRLLHPGYSRASAWRRRLPPSRRLLRRCFYSALVGEGRKRFCCQFHG
jgi:hypothetical protein